MIPKMHVWWRYAVPALAAGAVVFAVAQVRVRATTEDDKLSIIKQGTANAISTIRSGRGSITIHKWHLKSSGAALETDCTYHLAFIGDRFRLSKTWTYLQNGPGLGELSEGLVPTGSTMSYEVSYDGKRLTVYYPDKKKAIVGDPTTLALRAIWSDYQTNVSVAGNCLINIANSDQKPGFSPAQLDGTQTFDGYQCDVIVSKQAIDAGAAGNYTLSYTYFVDPSRGFTVPRFQLWTEGSKLKQRVLSFDRIVALRDYGNGIWGPRKSTTTNYTLSNDGQSTRTAETTADFSDDFQLNVSLTENDVTLTLPPGTSVTDKELDAIYTVP